jgi:hypothetical protein
MTYKSAAQQRKFHAMAARGEISAKTVKEFDKSTDYEHLPEKAKAKAPAHNKPGDTTGDSFPFHNAPSDGGAAGSHEAESKKRYVRHGGARNE